MMSILESSTQPNYQSSMRTEERHFQTYKVSNNLLPAYQKATGRSDPPKWGSEPRKRKAWIQETRDPSQERGEGSRCSLGMGERFLLEVEFVMHLNFLRNDLTIEEKFRVI